jgi:5-hydroxyisourate hydrolase
MAGKLTTHALDTMHGCGAAGLTVEVRRVSEPEQGYPSVVLDAGGRGVLLEDGLERGVYDLVFHAADYFRAKGVDLPDPPFLDTVSIRFGVSDPESHHHVPLLVSPYAYSTYRGG